MRIEIFPILKKLFGVKYLSASVSEGLKKDHKYDKNAQINFF